VSAKAPALEIPVAARGAVKVAHGYGKAPFFSLRAALLCVCGVGAACLAAAVGKTYLIDGRAWSLTGTMPLLVLIAGGLLLGFGFAAGWVARKLCVAEVVFAAVVQTVLAEIPFASFMWAHRPWSMTIDPQTYELYLVIAAAGVAVILFLGSSLGFMLAGGGGLDLGVGYELFIALTFLRLRGRSHGGKRFSPSAVVTLIAVLAVVIGVMALTVVLSVMSGFELDLKRKILGTNAHEVVLKYGNDFREYPEVMKKVEGVSGVLGATPFTLNEVMISSESNLSGVVLKGIDPATVGRVTDLGKNVKEGDLSWLSNPELIPPPPSDEEGSGLSERLDKVLAEDDALNGVKTKDAHGPLPKGLTKDSVGTPHPALSPAGEREKSVGPPPVGERGASAKPVAGDTGASAKPVAGDTGAFAKPVAGERGRSAGKPPGNVLPGIVLGRELARSLRIYVGDKVNVVSPLSNELGPSGPIPKSRPFRVAAIFYSGMYEYDSKFAYLALPEAQKYFGTDGAITGLELKVDDLDATKRISRDILFALDGYPFHTKDWGEMNRNLFAALAMEKLVMAIILGFASLPVGFLILAILMFLAFEKSKEIAVLKSMGARDQSVMKVFVFEGLVIGGLGAVLGLGLGLLICLFIATGGIRLDPSVYYIDSLPVRIEAWQFGVVAGAALLLSYLATIYPAVAASRLPPVEGLRNE
jgi:lipoprotein-releasing system permease protein